MIATVPKENLLVWDLKEGWEPLCKFLNKPIPDQERKISRKELVSNISNLSPTQTVSDIRHQHRHNL